MSDPLRRRTEFADRLESLGFFRYAPPTAMASLKHDFRESGWTAVFGETGRLFNADAEDLAEGGVGEFLREIEPFLIGQGISLNQVEDEFSERGYWITVNGKPYTIYDTDELQRSDEQLGLFWGLSSARAFAIVNGLLEAAGSEERLYAVNGGNDLFGFFLTPALRETICGYLGVKPRDRPYVPTEEYPWFGQEQA